MRDYGLMRKLLGIAAKDGRPFGFASLRAHGLDSGVAPELVRLQKDGLLEGDLEIGSSGDYVGGDVTGLTDEGREFFRLVENMDAWSIMQSTLEAAGIDVPYPLLKEVCEEVVKRYVTSFIPEIRR